jgi:hypothetical protein
MESGDRSEAWIDRETLLAYDVPPSPPGLDDRVIAALQAGGHRRRRPRAWMVLGAAVAVAVAAFLLRTEANDSDSGRRLVSARESIAIGTRAVAVAESGSELSWHVLADGTATMEQPRGDVFYRVAPGRSFVVTLPGARIRVLGTCFRVEVTEMGPMRSRNRLLAAAAGAALSAAVVVTVYEGEVLLENPRGGVELGPGEQGRAAAGTSPAELPSSVTGDARTAVQALQSRVQDLEQKLRRSEQQLAAAKGSPPDPANPRKLFDAEARDPSWAATQERLIEERLTRFLGVDEGRATVECRHSCCQITFDLERDAQAAVLDDLQTDVGLNHIERGQSAGRMFSTDGNGMTRVNHCVKREDRGPGPGQQPDRGAEREALLAAARPAVEACMKGAQEPLELVSALIIDQSGAISHVKSDADPLSHPASECIEQAILAAARFAPSDRGTAINVRLHLDPPR